VCLGKGTGRQVEAGTNPQGWKYSEIEHPLCDKMHGESPGKWGWCHAWGWEVPWGKGRALVPGT